MKSEIRLSNGRFFAARERKLQLANFVLTDLPPSWRMKSIATAISRCWLRCLFISSLRNSCRFAQQNPASEFRNRTTKSLHSHAGGLHSSPRRRVCMCVCVCARVHVYAVIKHDFPAGCLTGRSNSRELYRQVVRNARQECV